MVIAGTIEGPSPFSPCKRGYQDDTAGAETPRNLLGAVWLAEGLMSDGTSVLNVRRGHSEQHGSSEWRGMFQAKVYTDYFAAMSEGRDLRRA